ncbi:uncharacterized protein [Henckelia pumila]|uniref:uncharacterized protein isoform X2 n=1 Tax=Henckelia pumila TaxID=405737 RepID=UPI003C6DCAB0
MVFHRHQHRSLSRSPIITSSFCLCSQICGQEGSNSSTLRRNSSASASLNNLALTSTTATSAPLRRTNNWCFDEKLFIQKLYKVYKISIGAACNISWPSHRITANGSVIAAVESSQSPPQFSSPSSLFHSSSLWSMIPPWKNLLRFGGIGVREQLQI